MGSKVIFVTDVHISSTTPASRIDNYTDTIFDKFEYVLNRCKELDAVLLLGGDLFMLPTQPDYIKNRLKDMILSSGVTVFSVAGNHDILYYNTEYLNRTSYDTLSFPGCIWSLNSKAASGGFDIGNGWTVYGHEFKNPKLPEVKSEKSVIISHTFYNCNSNDLLYTSKDEVKKSKARFICFGHDHNQYPIENVNGSLVVRPGALSRGTSHTENRTRVISYTVLDLERGTAEYKAVSIVNKFEDVFKENFDIKKEKKIVSFDEIQSFIDEFKKSKMRADVFDLLDATEVAELTKNRCLEYLGKVGLTRMVQQEVE